MTGKEFKSEFAAIVKEVVVGLNEDTLEKAYFAKKSEEIMYILFDEYSEEKILKISPKKWFEELNDAMYISALISLDASGNNDYYKDIKEWSEEFALDNGVDLSE